MLDRPTDQHCHPYSHATSVAKDSTVTSLARNNVPVTVDNPQNTYQHPYRYFFFSKTMFQLKHSAGLLTLILDTEHFNLLNVIDITGVIPTWTARNHPVQDCDANLEGNEGNCSKL